MIYIKYEYEAKFGPREELYDMTIDVETTIKEVKNKLNETLIFGELEPNLYFIRGVSKKTNIKRTESPTNIITNILDQLYQKIITKHYKIMIYMII